jgi:3-hydroxyacyl-[acyl-carrier-protein] dehydratase
MLQGILYETIAVDAAGATIRLLPESPVYKGHFPGYPITPGVCLVEIALELIAEMADQVGHDDRVRLVGAKNIKFTSPIMPEAETLLRFKLDGAGENRSVEVYEGDTLCAKMSLTLA